MTQKNLEFKYLKKFEYFDIDELMLKKPDKIVDSGPVGQGVWKSGQKGKIAEEGEIYRLHWSGKPGIFIVKITSAGTESATGTMLFWYEQGDDTIHYTTDRKSYDQTKAGKFTLNYIHTNLLLTDEDKRMYQKYYVEKDANKFGI